MFICIPIKLRTTDLVIREIKKIGHQADLIEIWLDQIKDLNLAKIIRSSSLPLICVNKALKEKGAFQGSEIERVKILQQAIDLGVAYIDIGLHTNKNLIKKLVANKKNTKIIISYHNFTKTPTLKEILKITKKAYNLGADIAKIAVYAKNIEDNLTIFKTTIQLQAQDRKIISLCMGEKGRISRIVCPILGSYLMYAPLSKDKKTAPGQISVKELRKILEILKIS